MFKFFRKIRQDLLNKGKTAKYLKYAIGEIILVVIGILIALQINNWNENRKDRIKENQILVDLKKSLGADIENQLIPNMVQIEQDRSNIESIIQTLQIKLPFNDSIAKSFRSLMFSKSFKWELTAYKNLENVGLDIISKPELKDMILRLYNMNYPELEAYIDNFSNNLIEFFRPEMREKFQFQYVNSNEAYYTPIDYEALSNDISFMNSLLTAKINFSNIHGSLIKTKLDVEKVINSIDEALKERGSL